MTQDGIIPRPRRLESLALDRIEATQAADRQRRLGPRDKTRSALRADPYQPLAQRPAVVAPVLAQPTGSRTEDKFYSCQASPAWLPIRIPTRHQPRPRRHSNGRPKRHPPTTQSTSPRLTRCPRSLGTRMVSSSASRAKQSCVVRDHPGAAPPNHG
jgi:hypothetical protein